LRSTLVNDAIFKQRSRGGESISFRKQEECPNIFRARQVLPHRQEFPAYEPTTPVGTKAAPDKILPFTSSAK